MVDWVSGLADASVAERDSGFTLIRVPGSPDALKEVPLSDFLAKDSFGNYKAGAVTSVGKMSIGKTSSGASVIGLSLANAADATGTGISLTFINHSSGTLVTGAIQNVVAGSNNYPMDFATYGTSGLINKWRMEAEGNFRPLFDNAFSVGVAAQRCSVIFAGTGSINTSDQREKTDIGEIPDAWLDAWAEVQWRRFKFVNRTRWHVGLVAQEVHAVFSAHDLDAFEIGLCCFDEWEEVRQPIFATVTKTRKVSRTELVAAGQTSSGSPTFTLQEIEVDEDYEETLDTGETRIVQTAGDRWGLRYDECQAMEAAYQRRENARIAARLAVLEGAA